MRMSKKTMARYARKQGVSAHHFMSETRLKKAVQIAKNLKAMRKRIASYNNRIAGIPVPDRYSDIPDYREKLVAAYRRTLAGERAWVKRRNR